MSIDVQALAQFAASLHKHANLTMKEAWKLAAITRMHIGLWIDDGSAVDPGLLHRLGIKVRTE